MAALGIGTAGFLPNYGLNAGPPLSGPEIIEAAVLQGVRYIDTAATYGSAETAVGAVADLLRSVSVRVCTKVQPVARDGSPGLVAELQNSLRRLRLESVDTLLLHSADPALLDWPAVQEELGAIKELALASRVGLSTYGPAAAVTALTSPYVDTVQVEHSVLNPSVLRQLRPHKRRGQEIVVRSVLCKGLLTARWRSASVVSPWVAGAIADLERIASSWDFGLPELAIRYALDSADVDVVVVGVGSRDELRVALTAAARTPLDADQLDMLASFDRSADDATHPERWVAVLS